MSNTTKVTERVYTHKADGTPVAMTEETDEALCSVELGETAKGEVQVKSVKVYAATAQEAAQEALATFRTLLADLAAVNAHHG